MHGKIIKFKGDISKGPLMINLETSQTELLPEETKNNANS